MKLRGSLYLIFGVAVGIATFGLYARQITPDPVDVQVLSSETEVSPATATAEVSASGQHPAPRANASAEMVASPARYSKYPRIADTYRKAREIPEILDGLYCHCDCARHAGHRSLLECFAGDHAAGCDVCLSEAETAYLLNWRGRPLDAIRTQLDATDLVEAHRSYLSAPQSKRIAHYGNRAETHRGGGDDRAQQNPQERIQDPRRDRHTH